MNRSILFLFWSVFGLLIVYGIISEMGLLSMRARHVLALVLGSLFLSGAALLEHFERQGRLAREGGPLAVRFSLLQLLILTMGLGMELGAVMDLLKSPLPFFLSWIAALCVPPLTLMLYALASRPR